MRSPPPVFTEDETTQKKRHQTRPAPVFVQRFPHQFWCHIQGNPLLHLSRIACGNWQDVASSFLTGFTCDMYIGSSQLDYFATQLLKVTVKYRLLSDISSVTHTLTCTKHYGRKQDAEKTVDNSQVVTGPIAIAILFAHPQVLGSGRLFSRYMRLQVEWEHAPTEVLAHKSCMYVYGVV